MNLGVILDGKEQMVEGVSANLARAERKFARLRSLLSVGRRRAEVPRRPCLRGASQVLIACRTSSLRRAFWMGWYFDKEP